MRANRYHSIESKPTTLKKSQIKTDNPETTSSTEYESRFINLNNAALCHPWHRVIPPITPSILLPVKLVHPEHRPWTHPGNMHPCISRIPPIHGHKKAPSTRYSGRIELLQLGMARPGHTTPLVRHRSDTEQETTAQIFLTLPHE